MKRRTDEILEHGFTDHVLVCTNDRDSDLACCGDIERQAAYEEVVAWLNERDVLWSHVYVSTCSCLGLCSADGVALAIHPRNEWFSDVKQSDVSELLTHELGSNAERLGIRD